MRYRLALALVLGMAFARTFAAGPAATPGASDQQVVPAPTMLDTQLEDVVVTGSRIPRPQIEGPSPIVVITSQDIANGGFANIPDVMNSLTQNMGALDNNQYTSGFTPGAQAVDLRGLGPNHTLVLVNGRRIADYPQAYGGNSNFTDISNIPTSLVDRVEVLTGSASAIYGSDAISGVINFILKKNVDETTVDLRVGDTQHGGGASQRLQISTGYSQDRFNAVFAVELYNLDPVWATQRSFTNSLLDGPGDPSSIAADPVFARYDQYGDYIDPGKATCASLSHLDNGSVFYATDPNGYGNYCGSYRDYAYATLENGDQAANGYSSMTFDLNENAHLFLDIQAGTSTQKLYNSPLQWQNSYILNNNSTPTPFFNTATGQVEQWQRQYFTINENGGFDPGEIHVVNHTLSLNTGVAGHLPNSTWDYELTFGYSQSLLENREPALIAAKAQALYLGKSLGIDPTTGLNEYYAPPSRLYTPLTVAQFRSISQDSVDNDKSHAETLTLQVSNSKLWQLPAGPLGFAGVIEAGSQAFNANPDPLSINGSYYDLANVGADGSRTHQGVGVEFRVPALERLTLTAASRYDRYDYSSISASKVTYSAGLEYRPFTPLLVRGSYSTGFRAPDLSYLYAGPSGSSSSGTDYYLCRSQYPQSAPDFYDNCPYGDVQYNGRGIGSINLTNETSRSYTAGFVFSPFKDLDFSADYYNIHLSEEVEYQSTDVVLRQEADCLLGKTPSGQPVNINSPTCQEVVGEVVRNPANAIYQPQQITSVLVRPINAATDNTDGIDVAAHYHLGTQHIGDFSFGTNVTRVLSHVTQEFPQDPVDNELTDLFVWVLPLWKANASTTWSYGPVTTSVFAKIIGGLPNYDGTVRLPTTAVYNGSISYTFNPHAQLRFTVDNLFDQQPQRDPSWSSWPFYSRNWFSPVGRDFYLEFTYKLAAFHRP